MASFTVRIFSASSSGISISNASSNAITNSTMSNESAPRSSTNEALGVTSPSSTPSCSTMICFTFSSTEAIDGLLLSSTYKPKVQWNAASACIPLPNLGFLLRSFLMLFDVAHRVRDRLDFFCLFIRDLDVESLFKGHYELDRVQRVSAQVIDERRIWSHFRFIHTQLLNDDLLYLVFD